jgi:hypothetical protein
VKALTAVPQVLAEMDRNARWTTDLGDAYYNQPQDVMQAIQVMRQRAEAAGNLQNTPQETVNYDQGNIELAPANPQVVYVPAYNPWSVYGQPVSPYPGFSLLGTLGSFFGSSPVSFGLGIAMTAFNNTPFGWLGWGLNWLAQAVLFNHANYFSHSTTVADWGFPHGGRRAVSQPGTNYGTMYGRSNGFNRGPGNYGQPRGGYNTGYGQGIGRAPQTFAGSRPIEGFNRGYQGPGVGYARPVPQAYNHMQAAINTARPYARPGYGYGFSEGGAYNNRGAFPGMGQGAYRPPAASFENRQFAQRSSGPFWGAPYGGKAFSGYKPPHSGGGFHLFGGGHSGGGRGFGGGHSGGGGGFGGGHSGGGGHSSGKHHR